MESLEKNRLFWKVFSLLFVGIMIVTSIFAGYLLLLQKKSIIELLHSEGKSISQSISFVTSDALIIDDSSYLVEFNSEYIKNKDKLKNIIVAKLNNQYFNIEKNSWSYLNKIDSSLLKMQKNTERYKIMYSPILKTRVFHYTYPIYFSGVHWGWLHLSFDIKDYDNKINELYLLFVYLFSTLIVAAFFISFYIANLFASPIIKLNQTATAIANGNLSVRSLIDRNDEIGELSNTFNIMVKNLEESQLKLRLSHEDLELRVQKRTQEVNKVNSNLELKTKELAELNKNLDSKVKEEISKRHKHERILIQQSRLAAMGEMIGNIAHQWRQPLNALGLIIQNIHFSYNNGVLTKEFVDDSMHKGVQLTNMMSKTIDDFRNFFQPNKQKEKFSLMATIDTTIDLIDAGFKHNNIKVKKDIKDEVSVLGFPNEFAQAMLNIFSNAKDALIENEINEGLINIKVYKEELFGCITISDNAGGIPADIIDKVFDPYFTTKHQYAGTGIGLYMSKIIIEQNMQGFLSVSNEEKGAVFLIKIPLSKDEVLSETPV